MHAPQSGQEGGLQRPRTRRVGTMQSLQPAPAQVRDQVARVQRDVGTSEEVEIEQRDLTVLLVYLAIVEVAVRQAQHGLRQSSCVFHEACVCCGPAAGKRARGIEDLFPPALEHLEFFAPPERADVPGTLVALEDGQFLAETRVERHALGTEVDLAAREELEDQRLVQAIVAEEARHTKGSAAHGAFCDALADGRARRARLPVALEDVRTLVPADEHDQTPPRAVGEHVPAVLRLQASGERQLRIAFGKTLDQAAVVVGEPARGPGAHGGESQHTFVVHVHAHDLPQIGADLLELVGGCGQAVAQARTPALVRTTSR